MVILRGPTFRVATDRIRLLDRPPSRHLQRTIRASWRLWSTAHPTATASPSAVATTGGKRSGPGKGQWGSGGPMTAGRSGRPADARPVGGSQFGARCHQNSRGLRRSGVGGVESSSPAATRSFVTLACPPVG